VRYLLPSYRSWRKKAVGGLLVIAFAPLLLVVAVRAVNEMARAILDVLGPFIPWAIAGVFLFGLYSLIIRRYRR
jgi:hypothetical protein